ncbi:MAG: hypothetical protein PHW02_05960 [bacterium]|nr:hypothetical protein [bacterium]
MSRKVWLAVFLIIAINIFSEEIVDTLEMTTDSITNSEQKEFNSNEHSRIKDKQLTCLKYSTIYFIPTAAYIYSIYLTEKPKKHNNFLVYCISYPTGFVLLEYLITDVVLNNQNILVQYQNNAISLNTQVGLCTPTSYYYDSSVPFPLIDAQAMTKIALEYEKKLKGQFSLSIQLQMYTMLFSFYRLTSYNLYSSDIGVELGNWRVSVNKNLFSYDFNENDETVNYGNDFWGFGIGWSKRFYPYKGILIEPNIAYRYSRTADYSTSIIGLFGGVNLGYRF